MTSTIGLWFCAMDFAFKATIRLLFIVPLLASTGAYAGEIEGEASAIDGDSLNMQIRLFAIDTPEADQTCKDHEGRGYPCGRIASDALARLLRDKIITCEIKTRDRYGRPVGICYADDVDIGGALVDQGLAVAFRRYSDKYVANEERARAAKRGLWAGTFEMPWEYRERKRRESAAARALPQLPGCPPEPHPLPAECAIKGNVSANGRIYHMPGSRDYDKVVIDPAKGERYFCSEEEARACGWRKPGE
jgi:endonuclease YncB( thermonuclease family)